MVAAALATSADWAQREAGTIRGAHAASRLFFMTLEGCGARLCKDGAMAPKCGLTRGPAPGPARRSASPGDTPQKELQRLAGHPGPADEPTGAAPHHHPAPPARPGPPGSPRPCAARRAIPDSRASSERSAEVTDSDGGATPPT